MSRFTFGAELELADIDTTLKLPEGNEWNYLDYTIQNSDGSWNDPLKLFNKQGSEINTKVTDTISDAVDNILDIFEALDVKHTSCNHSTNLHIHIGIKDIEEDTVKKLVDYVWRYQRKLFDIIKLPQDKKLKRRKVSNQLKIPTYVRNRVLAGDMDFGNTRFAINVKSILLRGTVEFRLFPMTLCPVELSSCFMYCESIVTKALSSYSGAPSTIGLKFPEFHYVDREINFKGHYGRNSRLAILRGLKQKPKVVFTCLGNVNRSKAAEIIFKSLDSENLFSVESYGTRDGTYGKPLHAQTGRLLKKHGYKFKDISLSKKFVAEEHKDAIVVDTTENIEDPGYTKDGHYKAFISIEALCKKLYKDLTNEEQ